MGNAQWFRVVVCRETECAQTVPSAVRKGSCSPSLPTELARPQVLVFEVIRGWFQTQGGAHGVTGLPQLVGTGRRVAQLSEWDFERLAAFFDRAYRASEALGKVTITMCAQERIFLGTPPAAIDQRFDAQFHPPGLDGNERAPQPPGDGFIRQGAQQSVLLRFPESNPGRIVNAELQATMGHAFKTAVDLRRYCFVRTGAEQTLFAESPWPALGMTIGNAKLYPAREDGGDTAFEKPGDLFVGSGAEDGVIHGPPRLALRIERRKALLFTAGNDGDISPIDTPGQFAIGHGAEQSIFFGFPERRGAIEFWYSEQLPA